MATAALAGKNVALDAIDVSDPALYQTTRGSRCSSGCAPRTPSTTAPTARTVPTGR